MKTCLNCFRNIDDDALFCPYCGYPQGEVGLKKCPRGHLIFEAWKDCPFCAEEKIINKTLLEGEETIIEADATILEESETKFSEGTGETKLDFSRVEFFAWIVELQDEEPINDFRILQEKIFMGRASSSEIVVEDDLVSKQHAAIYYKNGDFIIDDLNSKNGTFVNGQLIERAKLEDGDRIKLGKTEYLFKMLR